MIKVNSMDDAISRQAAKDMIKNHKSDFSTENDYRTANIADVWLPNAGDWLQREGGDGMNRLDNAISEMAYILDTLIAYRRIVQSGDCNSCSASKNCKYVPKLGEPVRCNCPFYKGRVTE